MEQNTKQKVKLIMVEEKPYVVSLDKIEIGDTVIVTVNGQYPQILKCENETIYTLVIENKFTQDQIEKILENDGIMDVEFDGTKYNYSL